MKNLIPLSLRGCGYIEDLELNDREAQLRIHVIPVAPHRSSTEVTLDCQILPHLKEKIRQLNRQHPVTDGVRISFVVDFGCFAANFSVNDSAGPQDMMILRGELRDIMTWRQDTTGIHPLR
jgi:hypothetical protein